MLAGLLAAATYTLGDNSMYSDFLGAASSGIEAMLPMPQFYIIHTNKHTHGCAIALILNWISGATFKLWFYVKNDSPIQLTLCTCWQLLVQIMIMG